MSFSVRLVAFLDLAIRGTRPDCTASERAAKELAQAAVECLPHLDEHATNGFVDFVVQSKLAQTKRAEATAAAPVAGEKTARSAPTAAPSQPLARDTEENSPVATQRRLRVPKRQTKGEAEAITCYILSNKQSPSAIAYLLGRSEDEVVELIALGERLATRRRGSRQAGPPGAAPGQE
jgi:hypothetical protein